MASRPSSGGGVVARHADRGLAALKIAPGVVGSVVDALARVAQPARIAVRGLCRDLRVRGVHE